MHFALFVYFSGRIFVAGDFLLFVFFFRSASAAPVPAVGAVMVVGCCVRRVCLSCFAARCRRACTSAPWRWVRPASSAQPSCGLFHGSSRLTVSYSLISHSSRCAPPISSQLHRSATTATAPSYRTADGRSSSRSPIAHRRRISASPLHCTAHPSSPLIFTLTSPPSRW